MSAKAMVEDLRRRDVRLEVDGLTLLVDAPSSVVTEELKSALANRKRDLIRFLERERRRLETADRLGLVIRWARESGYVALHDPTTGEWHEIPSSDCPAWVLEDAKARHRCRKARA